MTKLCPFSWLVRQSIQLRLSATQVSHTEPHPDWENCTIIVPCKLVSSGYHNVKFKHRLEASRNSHNIGIWLHLIHTTHQSIGDSTVYNSPHHWKDNRSICWYKIPNLKKKTNSTFQKHCRLVLLWHCIATPPLFSFVVKETQRPPPACLPQSPSNLRGIFAQHPEYRQVCCLQYRGPSSPLLSVPLSVNGYTSSRHPQSLAAHVCLRQNSPRRPSTCTTA